MRHGRQPERDPSAGLGKPGGGDCAGHAGCAARSRANSHPAAATPTPTGGRSAGRAPARAEPPSLDAVLQGMPRVDGKRDLRHGAEGVLAEGRWPDGEAYRVRLTVR